MFIYNLCIFGLKIFSSKYYSTDGIIAKALNFKSQYIDIYVNNWGPKDDGATLQGLGSLTYLAIEEGVTKVCSPKMSINKLLCIEHVVMRKLMQFGTACCRYENNQLNNKSITTIY